MPRGLQRILGEVEGKAEGIVEGESHFALELVAVLEVRGSPRRGS